MTTTPEAPAKSLTQRVAEEIRVVLARRQMRQSQLARQMGVTEQWLSVRLRGVQPIDLNDLERIADALGVHPFELWPRDLAPVNQRSHALNDRSVSHATRTTDERPSRARQPNGRPAGEPTRPASSVRPTQRRPSMVRPAGRTMPR